MEENDIEFDPKLILPNGYTLMVGSLLRCLFNYANDPKQIKQITQSTYATLYAAETDPGMMKEIIEDMVVEDQMSGFDSALNELLDSENPDDKEERK